MRAPKRRRPPRRKAAPAGAGASAAKAGSRAKQGGLAALAMALLIGAAGLAQQRADSDQDTLAPSRPIAVAPSAVPTGSSARDRARALTAMERDLAAAINAARNDAGLPMLTMDPQLTAAATGHSDDLLEHQACSHDGSDGSSLESRLKAAGVEASAYAETVACGSGSADEAVRQWLDSKAHRPIILGKAYRRLGVGVAVSADGADTRWTADLGTP